MQLENPTENSSSLLSVAIILSWTVSMLSLPAMHSGQGMVVMLSPNSGRKLEWMAVVHSVLLLIFFG